MITSFPQTSISEATYFIWMLRFGSMIFHWSISNSDHFCCLPLLPSPTYSNRSRIWGCIRSYPFLVKSAREGIINILSFTTSFLVISWFDERVVIYRVDRCIDTFLSDNSYHGGFRHVVRERRWDVSEWVSERVTLRCEHARDNKTRKTKRLKDST